jgi:hypothetical protein
MEYLDLEYLDFSPDVYKFGLFNRNPGELYGLRNIYRMKFPLVYKEVFRRDSQPYTEVIPWYQERSPVKLPQKRN